MAARDVADEVLDVVVGGRADELLAGAELHDLPVAHDRDAVAEAQRLGQVVGDEDHRLAGLVLQPHHLVLHVAADQRVERAERLVVEHHRRVGGERARDADALLHAAGELVGERVLDVLEPDESEHLAGALASRSAFATPWISSPKATFSTTRRCASSPKCWKIIETEWRRSSRSSAALAPVTSCPAIRIVPAVGSISRISVRTSVDLPEPERPITTNTSPGQTSSETSLTAATQPVLARSSERGSSASGVPTIRSALRAEDLPDAVRVDQRLAAARPA